MREWKGSGALPLVCVMGALLACKGKSEEAPPAASGAAASAPSPAPAAAPTSKPRPSVACKAAGTKKTARLLAFSGDSLGRVTVDPGSVYFGAHEGGAWGVYAVKKDGTGKTKLAAGISQDTHLVNDDDHVYWGTHDGGLKRVSKDGGEPAVVSPGMASARAMDGTHVYGSDKAGALAAAPKAGGEVRVLASTKLVAGIAVDDDAVYFADGTGGTISKVPKAGGTPTQIAKAARPIALALDDTTVFFATGTGGRRLLGVPKAGGDPAELARGVNDETLLFADASGVYAMYSAEYEESAYTYGPQTLIRSPKTKGKLERVYGVGASEKWNGIAMDGECAYMTVRVAADSSLYAIPK